MREEILICDSCRERVKCLYEIPRLVVEGRNINGYPGNKEICEKCARILCNRFNALSLIADDAK